MKLLVKEIKSKKGELHFRRWRLLWTPFFAVYVHGIYKADNDLDSHSHPWHFLTIILKGWYSERLETMLGDNVLVTREAGGIAFHTRGEYHRLLMIGAPVYSLVFTFGRHQDWGYLVHGEHVPHEIYRSLKNGETVQQTGVKS